MSCRLFKSVTVTSSGGNTIVDFGTIANFALQNLKDYKFIVCQQIPASDAIQNVQFKINGVTYSVLTNSGNTFLSDQLRQGIVYCAVYGNNPKHFLIKNCVPPTSFIPVALFASDFISDITGEAIPPIPSVLPETKTTTLKGK